MIYLHLDFERVFRVPTGTPSSPPHNKRVSKGRYVLLPLLEGGYIMTYMYSPPQNSLYVLYTIKNKFHVHTYIYIYFPLGS